MHLGPEEELGGGRWIMRVTDGYHHEHVIEVRGQGRKFLLNGARAVWLSYVVSVDGIEDIPQGRLWGSKADAFSAGVRYLETAKEGYRAG
jgi:hypothetical protein